VEFGIYIVNQLQNPIFNAETQRKRGAEFTSIPLFFQHRATEAQRTMPVIFRFIDFSVFRQVFQSTNSLLALMTAKSINQ